MFFKVKSTLTLRSTYFGELWNILVIFYWLDPSFLFYSTSFVCIQNVTSGNDYRCSSE